MDELTTGTVIGREAHAAAARPARSWRRPLIAGGAVLVLALVGVGWWLYARQFEDTDDAQIDGDISNISSRVAGNVKAVYVVDNQPVKAGDLLADIDPADLAVAVAVAKAGVAQAQAQLAAEDPTVSMTETANRSSVAGSTADLASAQASVEEARRAVDQITAQLAQAVANDKTLQLERTRAETLFADHAIAEAERDQRSNAAVASTANLRSLEHALEAAKDRVTAQQARLGTIQSKLDEVRSNAPRELEARRAAVIARQAALDLAKAQLAQAELNLGYAHITAPSAGVIGRKSVHVGEHVAPGQQLIAIAQTAGLWVTANFRETQLRQVRVGQSVDVSVDSLGETFHGVVSSIGGATGSRFSVLPPENATGNYVKVVQRVPVRIELDPGQPGLDRLRPGMSVEPKVRVR
jgi:membrane fusion protein (multidrug efflux system)